MWINEKFAKNKEHNILIFLKTIMTFENQKIEKIKKKTVIILRCKIKISINTNLNSFLKLCKCIDSCEVTYQNRLEI